MKCNNEKTWVINIEFTKMLLSFIIYFYHLELYQIELIFNLKSSLIFIHIFTIKSIIFMYKIINSIYHIYTESRIFIIV